MLEKGTEKKNRIVGPNYGKGKNNNRFLEVDLVK